MTRYRTEITPRAVDIELTDVGGQRDALLGAFTECAEGRCSCPTNEFQKVASMRVEGTADRIEIELEAKPGRDLDLSEIELCLAHTVNAVDIESRPGTASAKEVNNNGIR